MKALVTGGAGFIGSHTVSELLGHGHDVRVLTRRPQAEGPALKPLGVSSVEVIQGDVTDPRAVEEALTGCNAVIHCAAVYSLDPRRDGEVRSTNVLATKLVLGAAMRMGLDPIVHVSSVAALIGERYGILSPASEPTHPPGAYFRSKADADRAARALQERGAPVVIIYPPAVWGPQDPGFGVSSRTLRSGLMGLWAVTPAGTIPSSDVRDVAKLHALVLEPGRGPRRYMTPTHNVTMGQLADTLRAITGRRLPSIQVPGSILMPPLYALLALQRVLGPPNLANPATVYFLDRHHRVDDSAARSEFGLEPLPFAQSIADSVRWLVEAGHVAPKWAGKLSGVEKE